MSYHYSNLKIFMVNSKRKIHIINNAVPPIHDNTAVMMHILTTTFVQFVTNIGQTSDIINNNSVYLSTINLTNNLLKFLISAISYSI